MAPRMSMRHRGSNHRTRIDKLYSGWDFDKTVSLIILCIPICRMKRFVSISSALQHQSGFGDALVILGQWPYLDLQVTE